MASALRILRRLAPVLWLAAAAAWGDPRGHYSFKAYGRELGLSNLSVQSMAEDADGFVWVGTEDGAFRWDGQHFARFGEAEGLPSATVAFVYGAPDGHLWIATEKGLCVLENGRFRPVAGLPAQRIRGVSGTRSGYVLVATKEGLFAGSATRDFTPAPGFPVADTNAVFVDEQGEIAAQGAKLLLRDRAGALLSRDSPLDRVQALLRDNRGRIWLRGRTLFRLDTPASAFVDLTSQLPGEPIYRGLLVPDASGRIWMPTNRGLGVWENERMSMLTERDGIPGDWVSAALVDREGSLWLANEGVYRLLGRFQWTAFDRREGLPSDLIWAILRDRQGTLWVGGTGGLIRSTHDRFELVPGTRERVIYALGEDARGGLWAGGSLGKRKQPSLLYKAPGASTFRDVPIPSMGPRGTISSLAALPDELLIGTLTSGMYAVEPRKLKSRRIPLPEGAPDEQIEQVIASGNEAWAASNAGILHWDGRAWTRQKDGLPDLHINTVVRAPDGAVLLAFWNARQVLRLRNGHTEAPFPASLSVDSVASLAFDAHGDVWAGTAGGVKRLRSGRVEQAGKLEGLPGDDCSGNALWLDPDGTAWVGTSKGLARYHPEAITPELPPPNALVTGVGTARGLRGPGRAVQLPWAERSVEVRFAAPSFAREAQNRFEVRLLGLEDDWTPVESRVARYPALPAGSYTFQVRASRGDGDWGPVAAQPMVVLTPWWQTLWFRLVIALAVAAGVGALVRLRLRWLERENERLEALVRARTRELEEASLIDPLTGLRNRRFLSLALPPDLARSRRAWISHRDRGLPGAPERADLVFLLVDLDDFKSVNDTYGHAAGDQVLQQFASVLRGACREMDTVVRWGGEEFMVVAQPSGRDGAPTIASHICSAVRGQRFSLPDGRAIQRTVSIGFAVFPLLRSDPDAASWELVVEIADRCLYAAKRGGRDGWVGVMGGHIEARELSRGASALDEVFKKLDVRRSR